MTRSLLLEAPRRHRLVEAETPSPGPYDAVVRVHAAGICGSDRELYEGTRPAQFRSYPVVPGHEWSGTVESVGGRGDPALIGTPVVGEGFRNCGGCERCRYGDTNLCAAGYDETGFTRPGGFAERLVLPARLLHRLEPDTDLTAAALLEPAAVAAAAVLRADVVPGCRVAVVGAGSLGTLAVQLLAGYSPRDLLAVDPRIARAETVRRGGATEVRTPEDAAGAEGTFDVVVETAGVAGSALAAARLARPGGTVVLAGIPGGPAHDLPPALVVGGQLTVTGVFGAPAWAWAHAVRCFAAGLLDLRAVITHELPLDGYGQALDLLGDPGTGKVVLRP